MEKVKKPFYKRGWFIGLVVILVIGMFGSSTEDTSTEDDVVENSGNTTTDSESAGVDETNMKVVSDEWELNLLDAAIVKDWEGNNVIRLGYDYTNNSEEPASPLWTTTFKYYQNNVEITMDNISDEVDLGAGQAEVLPTGKIERAEDGANIADNSKVTVYIEDMISFDSEPLAIFEVDVETLEIVRVK